MAHLHPDDVDPGDPALADWAQILVDNDTYMIDDATGFFETGLVVADSIATDAVGAAEIGSGVVGQDEIGPSAVGQGELKTSTEEVSQSASVSTWYNKQMTSTEYGHNYQHKASGGTSDMRYIEAQSGISSYSNWVALRTTVSGTQTVYCYWRYHTASPPYAMGDLEGEDWGMFMWVCRDADGRVISARRSMDPAWAFEAKRLGLPKNHPGNLYLRPNPFAGDTLIPNGQPGEMPPGATISLIDLRDYRQRVKRNRCARECAALQARRGEFLARGLPVQLIDQLEAQAAAKAQAEAQENLKMENALDGMDAAVERTIDRLGRLQMRRARRLVHPPKLDTLPNAVKLGEVKRPDRHGKLRTLFRVEHDQEYLPRTPAQMAVLAPMLRRKAEKRKAWLRHQLFKRTRMDEIEEDLAAQGKSILQALHESEGHGPEEDKSRPVVEECCGVNWKAIRESDTTLPGGADVPGLKEAGVRVVGR